MKTLLLMCTFDREDPGFLGPRYGFPVPDMATHLFQEACDYVVEHYITPEFMREYIEEEYVGESFMNDCDLEEEPSSEKIKCKWCGYRNYHFEFDFEDDQGNEVTIRKSIEFMKLVE